MKGTMLGNLGMCKGRLGHDDFPRVRVGEQVPSRPEIEFPGSSRERSSLFRREVLFSRSNGMPGGNGKINNLVANQEVTIAAELGAGQPFCPCGKSPWAQVRNKFVGGSKECWIPAGEVWSHTRHPQCFPRTES
jgi:hypothetical protein